MPVLKPDQGRGHARPAGRPIVCVVGEHYILSAKNIDDRAPRIIHEEIRPKASHDTAAKRKGGGGGKKGGGSF